MQVLFRKYCTLIALPGFLCCVILSGSQGSDETAQRESAPASSELSTLPDASAPEAWSEPSQIVYEGTDFRGNWFKKRTIVNDARTLYEEIHTYVTTTWEPQFQEFDAQYKNSAIEMKKSIEGLPFAKQDFETARSQLRVVLQGDRAAEKPPVKKVTQVPEKPKFSEEQIATFETQLVGMQERYNRLEELLQLFESAIQQGQQQVAKGAEQEQAAWKLYEEIDAAYNDQQAALAFEQMKASRAYLQQLLGYLQQQLAPYCQQLATQFNQEILALASQVRELETQGVAIRPQKVAVTSQAPSVLPVSWWSSMWSWIMAPVQWVRSIVQRLWGK